MVKCIAVMVSDAVRSVFLKHQESLFDPHEFLACIGLMQSVEVADKKGNKSELYVADDESLANAVCFQAQMEEINKAAYAPQLGGEEKLGHFLKEPLREYELNQSVLTQIANFLKSKKMHN